MSQQTGVLDITLKAAINLDGKQYHIVKLHSTEGEVTLATAKTDVLFGVLQNEPASTGQAAVVRVLGTSKVKLGGTAISINAFITSSSASRGVANSAAGGTAFVLGVLMETGAAGDICEVLIDRFRHIYHE